MGVDPRDAAGSTAHHHYLALAFVAANVGLAFVLFYIGVVVIVPDIGNARGWAAAAYALLIGLADLYVVSERDRHPHDADAPPPSVLRHRAGRVAELLPRLLLSAVSILGLGLLLSVKLNADAIHQFQGDSAQTEVDKRTAQELKRYEDSVAENQALYERAAVDAKEADTVYTAKKALYGCERFGTPAPSVTPGCDGNVGPGRNSDDAADARDAARATWESLGRIAASRLADLQLAQQKLDSRRDSIGNDPRFQAQNLINNGWASSLRELRRYQDAENQTWIESWWPEVTIAAVELGPLLFILFTGLTTSRINRDRRLRAERRMADQGSDDDLYTTGVESSLRRGEADDRVRRRDRFSQMRFDSEEASYAEWLQETKPLPRDATYHPGGDPGTPDEDAEDTQRANSAATGRASDDTLDEFDALLDGTSDDARAVEQLSSSVARDDVKGLDEADDGGDHFGWRAPIIPEAEERFAWEEGALLELQGGRYRLVCRIADPNALEPFSSSLVWLATLVDPPRPGVEQPRWAALKLIPATRDAQDRLRAERLYVETMAEQDGVVRIAGSRELPDGVVFAYEYWPRSDALHYVFGAGPARPVITLGDLLDWLDDGLDGLARMWHYGLLHNDIKLLNLLVTGPLGQPPTGDDDRKPTRSILVADFDSVTRMDDVASVPGITPEICAPEVYAWLVARGVGDSSSSDTEPPLTPRSDLYGLFSSIYQVASGGQHPRSDSAWRAVDIHSSSRPTLHLSGVPTVEVPDLIDLASSTGSTAGARLAIPPDPMKGPIAGLPEAFARLLWRGIHEDPAQRFPEAGDSPRDLAQAARYAVVECRRELSRSRQTNFTVADQHLRDQSLAAPIGWPPRT